MHALQSKESEFNLLSFSTLQGSDGKEINLNKDIVETQSHILFDLDQNLSCSTVVKDNSHTSIELINNEKIENLISIQSDFKIKENTSSPKWNNNHGESEERTIVNRHKNLSSRVNSNKEVDNFNDIKNKIKYQENNLKNKNPTNFIMNSKNLNINNEVINKYCNILGQKKYTGNEAQKRNSYMKSTIDRGVCNEYNKTPFNAENSNLSSRRVSQSKSKKNIISANSCKSAGRIHSK